MAETKTQATEKVTDQKVEIKYGPPRIQTFEDAVQAYLREEIDKKQLEEARGVFGVSNEHVYIPPLLDRPDRPFQRDLPDDLFVRQGIELQSLEEVQKAVDEKEKEREAARKVANDLANKARENATTTVPYDEVQRELAREREQKEAEKAAKSS